MIVANHSAQRGLAILLVNNDSPLRRLPNSMDAKQAFFLDGIRYSIEMADLSRLRLQQNLYKLASSRGDLPHNDLEFVSAFLDAWSIVDSVHRLRGLLNQMPGFKKGTPGYQVFRRRTDEIESLRHTAQHLNTELNSIVDQGLPLWGVLSWVTVPDPDRPLMVTCSIIAGRVFSKKGHPIVNPAGKEITLPFADLITLTANGHSICLSDVMKIIEKFTGDIEEQLKEQFADLPTAAADLLVRLTLEVNTKLARAEESK